MNGNKKNLTFKIAIALISAIVIYVLLTNMGSMKYPNGEVTLYLAKKDIATGEEITLDSFEEITNDAKLKTEKAITDPSEIIGMKSKKFVAEGTILTNEDFEDKDSILNRYIQPVEITVNAKDISNSVTGITAGDKINICTTDSNSKKTERILKDIYVKEVVTAEGNTSNQNQAVLFTVLLEEQQSLAYKKAVDNGNITIEKVVKE